MRYDNITFLSDYGTADEFVGVCKSVIRATAPNVNIVDLSHDIAAFDVRGASLTLVRAANYLLPGVVLGVVDPGTGTSRRAIAVELGDGESVLVGPDNGLFAPVTALVGGATRAVELNEPKYWLETPSHTFSGRDVFAPVAAHLCNGVALTDLGEEIDPATLIPGLVPFSGAKEGVLHADVIWIDRFGNAQLNVSASQLEDFGDTLSVTHSSNTWLAYRVRTFSDLEAGHLGVIEDAHGMVAIVANHASVAARHQISVGDPVTLR